MIVYMFMVGRGGVGVLYHISQPVSPPDGSLLFIQCKCEGLAQTHACDGLRLQDDKSEKNLTWATPRLNLWTHAVIHRFILVKVWNLQMQFRNEQYPNEKNIFYTYVFIKACAHDESEHLPLRTRTFSPEKIYIRRSGHSVNHYTLEYYLDYTIYCLTTFWIITKDYGTWPCPFG